MFKMGTVRKYSAGQVSVPVLVIVGQRYFSCLPGLTPPPPQPIVDYVAEEAKIFLVKKGRCVVTSADAEEEEEVYVGKCCRQGC